MKGPSLTYRTLRLIFRLWLSIVNRVTVSGSSRIPATGAAILCANHSSYFDAMLLALCTKRHVRFIIFRDFYHHPILGFFVRACGAIPVSQQGMDKEALASARQTLEEGGIIAIFPEGRLSRAGFLSRPQQGAAHLAILTGAPLVPITIHGAFHVYRHGWKLPRIGTISVRVHSPLRIPSDLKSRRDMRKELTMLLMTSIRQEIRAHHRPRHS
jgi:1-acyl-sn-glycerol-3-phosphate acyltransferase